MCFKELKNTVKFYVTKIIFISLNTQTYHANAINGFPGKYFTCGNVIPVMAVYFQVRK